MNGKINWEVLSLTRFLLALIVLIGHLEEYSQIGYLKWYSNFGPFEAILGFLLISGLSIGKSISKDKTNYFKRRFQRIYPVYAASIFLQVIVDWLTLNASAIFIILLNLTFLNQIFTDTSFVVPAWTLATEVWLYALAPLFLKSSKRTLYILITASFTCYLFYTCGRTLFDWYYYSGTKYGINVILLAYIWIAGFVLSIFPNDIRRNKILVALLFIGHIGITVLIQVAFRIKNHQYGEIINVDLPPFIGKSCCLAFVYFVVLYNQKIRAFKPFANKVFNLLGNISYPLYLSHIAIFQLLKKFQISNVFVLITSALLVSYLIYYIFDFYSKKRVVKEPGLKGAKNPKETDARTKEADPVSYLKRGHSPAPISKF
jgi:peptidoglycan/LPS O-acetylase OafA/YrhL